MKYDTPRHDTPRQIAFMALKIAEANEREAASKVFDAEASLNNASRRYCKASDAYQSAKLQTAHARAELEKLPPS